MMLVMLMTGCGDGVGGPGGVGGCCDMVIVVVVLLMMAVVVMMMLVVDLLVSLTVVMVSTMYGCGCISGSNNNIDTNRKQCFVIYVLDISTKLTPQYSASSPP